jgi:hypothetical protein
MMGAKRGNAAALMDRTNVFAARADADAVRY